GKLREWDARGQQVHRVEDGELNQSVVYLPERNQFLTASYLKAKTGPATFTLWDAQPAVPVYTDYKLHGTPPTYYVPYAVAPTLLPGNRAAAVCYFIGGDEENPIREYRLCVLDTAQLRVVGEVPIWDGLDGEFPVVAVDPAGESV